MRRIIIIVLLSAVSILKAQKLETRIPKDVDMVVSMSGENLLELISVAEFDKSSIGKEMLKGINRRREDKITSIDKVGFNVASNAYYFFKDSKEVGFHNFFFELNDVEKFKTLISKRDLKKIKVENGLSYIEDSKSIRIWNDKSILVLFGFKVEGNLKREILKKRVKEYAFHVFKSKNKEALVKNRAFQKAKKKNSFATVWISNYGRIMSGAMRHFEYFSNGGIMSSIFRTTESKNIYGIEEVTANLFFEKDNVNMVVDMEVSSGVRKSFKKMYNRKMDKSILNSFDHNNILAFASLSMNTEEILLEYPSLVNKLYGNVLPRMKEEISVVTDLFSLVVDEEAIGDLITGNALFVLNDFSKQEVEYVTYKYDEDYKRKKIIKKKEEMVPDFTLMVGSKKEKLVQKILKLGLKHGILTKEGNVFELKENLPFKLYLLVKDEVLYVTNSQKRSTSILLGKKKYGSSNYSKLIKNSSALMYVNIHKLMNNVPEDMFRGNDKRAFDFGHNNLKDAYIKASKMKGSKISTELKLRTGVNEKNSLKLFFKFMDEMAAK